MGIYFVSLYILVLTHGMHRNNKWLKMFSSFRKIKRNLFYICKVNYKMDKSNTKHTTKYG